ncbi:MAG: ATP-binding protein [Thermoleophilia bacterium]|jgi:anti-sigma regulatory factor (Ser/Thr protein kinase)|nr:ATP-binding protein [Thermoleophilia bacterium]
MAAPATGPRVVRRREIPAGPGLLLACRAEVDAVPGITDAARSDLVLLVGELAGNAVRHAGMVAGEPVGLLIEAVPGVVRVEVRDPGPGFAPRAPARPPDEATTGRGLWLVEQVADRWGAEHDGRGCVVWFELWTGSARTRHLLRPAADGDDGAGLGDSELKGRIADLTRRERAVSAERARLHARLRALTAELARREREAATRGGPAPG